MVWRKVRVITTINAKSQYAVSPSANLSQQGKLVRDFESRYGENTFEILSRLLRDIASGAQFGNILQRELKRHDDRSRKRRNKNRSRDSKDFDIGEENGGAKEEEEESIGTKSSRLSKTIMGMIQWLLRMNVIVEVHEYVVFERGVRAWSSSAKRENFNTFSLQCFCMSLVFLNHTVQENHLKINTRTRTRL